MTKRPDDEKSDDKLSDGEMAMMKSPGPLEAAFHAESKNDVSFMLKFNFDLEITMQMSRSRVGAPELCSRERLELLIRVLAN